jgi:hypothetical protein
MSELSDVLKDMKGQLSMLVHNTDVILERMEKMDNRLKALEQKMGVNTPPKRSIQEELEWHDPIPSSVPIKNPSYWGSPKQPKPKMPKPEPDAIGPTCTAEPSGVAACGVQEGSNREPLSKKLEAQLEAIGTYVHITEHNKAAAGLFLPDTFTESESYIDEDVDACLYV